MLKFIIAPNYIEYIYRHPKCASGISVIQFIFYNKDYIFLYSQFELFSEIKTRGDVNGTSFIRVINLNEGREAQ